MIEPLTETAGNVLAFKISGKLHDEDYKAFVPQVDKAIELMPRVEKFLKQDVGERSTFEQTRQALFQLAAEWKF